MKLTKSPLLISPCIENVPPTRLKSSATAAEDSNVSRVINNPRVFIKTSLAKKSMTDGHSASVHPSEEERWNLTSSTQNLFFDLGECCALSRAENLLSQMNPL